uniref:Ubiquitin thioesterase n=1 Tax=Tetraselmis chuii TaxID=63592 RepID=A0A7S1SSY6_9CHLO|mmetsp:Transcript_27117/g.48334  ORF Transcript_27117/g.48334 Transcript_27117/m.48334 type:complete len:287 (+) Transcript_27117:146-1006(+)
MSSASADAAEGQQPTDEQIIEQENAIRASEAEGRPLVGEKEPLQALKAEYGAGSAVFVKKIESLMDRYSGIRRARGDGNCFYRSFVFGYLESLLISQNCEEKERMLKTLVSLKAGMVSHGYEELVIDEPIEILQDILNSVGSEKPLSVAALEHKMREQHVSDYIVMFLRLLVSYHVQSEKEFFAPFVMGMSDECLSVDTFCERMVEPMGVESDHVHIVALQRAVQVPIRIVYLDSSVAPTFGGADSESSVVVHDFTPDEVPPSAPTVHVLYRPGHYDILYSLPKTA